MYSIIELQTTNGQTVHLYQTAETQNEAMSKYHSILSYAATSNITYHACVVMDEEGKYIARECYRHYNTPTENTAE